MVRSEQSAVPHFAEHLGRDIAEGFVVVDPRAHQKAPAGSSLRLAAEVTFSTWTADNLLRHPSFEGLREDKSAREVKFERPSHKAS